MGKTDKHKTQSPKQSEDSSHIVSLSESKNRIESTETTIYEVAENRQLQIDRLTVELDQKDKMIRHLELLIQKMVPKLGEEANGLLHISDEEIIVIEQIERLKHIGKQRQMSPDEVKMLDTLIKNKRLLQGKSTTINADYERIKDLGTEDLLALASKK